jgi:thiol-disulfide isomerase/thioredoxin
VVLLAWSPVAFCARPLAAEEPGAIFKLQLEDLNGEELKLAELLDDGAVLLEFWATWCKPCQISLPEMQKLHQDYAERGLTVIAISVDGPRNFSKIRPFASRLNLKFPIVLDTDGDLQRGFKVTAIPTSILYDSAGEVVRVRQGYRPGETKEYAKLLDDLLPAAPADSLESVADADTAGTPASSSR